MGSLKPVIHAEYFKCKNWVSSRNPIFALYKRIFQITNGKTSFCQNHYFAILNNDGE